MSGLETRHCKGLGRRMCVFLEIWGSGCAFLAAERTAVAREEAGRDIGCVVKETLFKVIVFLRRKDKHVEMF